MSERAKSAPLGRDKHTLVKRKGTVKFPNQKKSKPKLTKLMYPVHKYRDSVPVEDTGLKMEYRLDWEHIYRIRKNKFHVYHTPKYEVVLNKAAELRDEYSTYCGQKKTIKNWLFYV